MREKFIIGDVARDLIWYGPYAVMRFSKPGFTKDLPALFDTFDQAYEECANIQKAYKGHVLAIARMYIFKNPPPEKIEILGRGKRVFLEGSAEYVRKLPFDLMQDMAFCHLQLCNTETYLN